jgi:hypothetical protein
MNLVDLVSSQLTGDVLGKLGGLIGANESQTRSATTAAVPALLSALSGMASTNSGADKLASAMGGLDLNMLGNLAGLLGGGQASSLGNIGGSLLGSLLGGGGTSKIVETLATFAGMQPGIMKTLLTYLAPIVLGTIAKQFKGRPDAAGLARLFTEQQGNIRNAIPRGLSLGDFATTGGSPRPSEPSRGGHRHDEPAPSGLPGWLLPLLVLGALGLGYYLWNQSQQKEVVVAQSREERGGVEVDRTAVIEREGRKIEGVVEETVKLAPSLGEADRVVKDLTGLFTGLGKVLGGVNDTTSAEVAVPQLKEFLPQLDAVQTATNGLPSEGKSLIAKMVSENLAGLQKVIDTVLAIPGVRDVLGPVVTPMIETLSKLGK